MSPAEILALARRLEAAAGGAAVLAEDGSGRARDALLPALEDMHRELGQLADALSDQLDRAEGEI